MKYLTAPYLSLMNAFKDHSDDVISKFYKTGHHENYSRIALMQEYRTLRLDAGRQSGKTEAVAMFAEEWLEEGGHIICLGFTDAHAQSTAQRIRSKCRDKINLPKGYRNNIFTQSIRAFLSDSGVNRYRGLSMEKVLIIIDEPCHKMPEIYKFYDAFENGPFWCTVANGRNLPLFFVMGIQ